MRWILPPHRQTARRPGQRGQGLVEFSLVGGLFFFLVFSIVNAGFFLYGRGAVEHAADVGMAAIAAEGGCTGGGGVCATIPASCLNGNDTTADYPDELAICRMDQAGLTTTPFIKVTSIYVYLIQQNPDAVKRFVKGWLQSIAYMKSHKEETVEIARKITGFSKPVEEREYDLLMPYFSTDGKFDAKALAATAQSFVDLKMLDTAPDMSKLYTERFLP